MQITHLSNDDLLYISEVIEMAIENGQYVRFSQQNGRLMVARGGGMWTAPMGEDNSPR